MPEKNYGFIPDEFNPKDYVLGGFSLSPKKVLKSDGNWADFLPLTEPQSRSGVETFSCVSFATLNALEILARYIWGENKNYSDRALAIASNTTKNGNSPNQVAEAVRKIGLVLEDKLPFWQSIYTWEEYHSPKPLTKDLLELCARWLKEYDFFHEWVFDFGETGDKQVKLKEALKYSPVLVSVDAWHLNEKGLYYKEGKRDNHATLCIASKEGEYWVIFDSYPGSDGRFIKHLEWNYDFGCAKRFSLDKRPLKSFWERLLNYFGFTLK